MRTETKCRTCRADIMFAVHHADDRRLPYETSIVSHETPDADVLVRSGGEHTAWTHADLVHDVAMRRGWSDAQAAEFVGDTFTSHRRHRCHQEPQ